MSDWRARTLVPALLLAALLTGGSLLGLLRLGFEPDFIAIVEPPALAGGSEAAATLSLWQDPPLSLLLTWQEDTLDGAGAALSDLAFALSFEPGVQQVVSAFSPTVPGSEENPLATAVDTGGDVPAALAAVRESTPFGASLISPDLRTMLLQVQGGDVVALAEAYTKCPTGEGFCIRSIGSKTIEETIQGRLQTENAYLPALSALACLLVLSLWFGSLARGAALMIPPTLGTVWYLGSIGALGIPIDPFNAIIPSVVLTLGTADMLHLQRARDVTGSARAALREVLPAVSITTFTTALAFGTLALEGSVVLERLAISGVSGVAILWVVVVLIGPLCVRPQNATTVRTAGLLRHVNAVLDRRLRALRVMAVGALAFGVVVALATPSDFTFHENIPRGEVADAFAAADDAGLVLAPMFHVLDPADRDAAARQLTAATENTPAEMFTLSDIETDDGLIVLPSPVPYGARATEIVEEAQRVTTTLSQAGSVTASGYPLNVAETVLRIVDNLQVILFACFALHAVVIGVLMHSARVALATLVPNAVPIFAIYVVMQVGTGWIDVSAAVAMILVSGLVVDDTTHILWAAREAAGRRGIDIRQGLARSFEPVLVTTLVLAAGFAPLLTAALPGMQTLGGLMILALVVAWASDTFLLPALFPETAREQS